MAPKRKLFLEEEDEIEDEYTRTRKLFWRIWTEDIKPDFVDTFHRMVSQFASNSPGSSQGSILRPSNPFGSFASNQYQLHFRNDLPKTLYTDNKFSTSISLRDSTSKEIIKSTLLSSIKIEVVVLHGDFCFEKEDIKMDKYFDDNIVRARDGKRILLVGCLKITLRDGVGLLHDVAFTDNSRWDRTGKFRLGARALLDDSCHVRVQEAVSEAFMVKDNRVKATEKCHPPLLDNEVWCLEKIKKTGVYHTKLRHLGIKTVEDFLKFYVTGDKCCLQEIFGEKTLETVIQHARECVLDPKRYMYKTEENNTVIVFNSIFEVVGAYFSGHEYVALHRLTDDQKKSLEKLKMRAYTNMHDMAEIDNSHIDVLQDSRRIESAFVYEHSCINESLNPVKGPLEVPLRSEKKIHPNQDRSEKYLEGTTGYRIDPRCSNPMNFNGNDSHHGDCIPCFSSFCGSTSSNTPKDPHGQLDGLAMCEHISLLEDSYHDAEQTFSSGHDLQSFLQACSCPGNNYQINETAYAEVTSYNPEFNMSDRRKQIARRKWGVLVVILKFKISTRKRFAARRSHMKRHANWVKVKAALTLGISTYNSSKLNRWMQQMVEDDPIFTCNSLPFTG